MKKTTKCILGALAILAAFTFISCQSDDGGSDNNDAPNVKLPGTPGGTSNPNDIFAGKTFYDDDNDDKDKKFEFSGNGM